MHIYKNMYTYNVFIYKHDVNHNCHFEFFGKLQMLPLDLCSTIKSEHLKNSIQTMV